MKRIFRAVSPMVAFLLAIVVSFPCLAADEPRQEGGWLHAKNEQTGINLYTMEMTLHPKPEPRPALKYRLVPDDFDLLDGNAAVHYMKAMGFLKQDPARKLLIEAFERADRQAKEEGKHVTDVPPHSWRSMAPKDLPLEEVKEFLELTAFQPHWIAEAAQRRCFDLDRNFRGIDDPMGYILPEIQSMRELARMQTLRCRLAIAEDRIDDALDILGQQYALARHIGQDKFAISSLVAFACAGIAWEDALYVVQHEDTQNLYWAFAALPRRMIDITRSGAMERQMLYLQCKALREVDESPRSEAYWDDFVERLLPQLGDLSEAFGLPQSSEDPETTRAAMTEFISAAYPEAKQYLLEDCGLEAKKVEAYPAAQTVFLAIVRYYEESRDTSLKWAHFPYWQTAVARRAAGIPDGEPKHRASLFAAPSERCAMVTSVVHSALAHFQQNLALIQAVEAIRMYGAAHNGELPPSLDDLPVPVPVEPFTGKPLDYEFCGDHAILTGHEMPSYQCKLVLRFVK